MRVRHGDQSEGLVRDEKTIAHPWVIGPRRIVLGRKETTVIGAQSTA